MSNTFFKLDKSWQELLRGIDEQVLEFGLDALGGIVERIADDIAPDTSDEEFKEFLGYITAVYLVWREDPGVKKLKFKKINKLYYFLIDGLHDTELVKEVNLHNFLAKHHVE